MTTGASSSDEVDVSTAVDSKTIVLVLDVGVGDVDTGGVADIKSIGVVAAVGDISGSVVDGNVIKGKTIGAVDRETLDRGVLDVESGDGGGSQAMSVEELENQ